MNHSSDNKAPTTKTGFRFPRTVKIQPFRLAAKFYKQP